MSSKPYKLLVARRALLLGGLGTLAACAFKPIALDPTLLARTKQVSVPTIGFPTSPRVEVINGIGKQLGLIGLISTAIVTGNRSDAVTALMKAQDFDPHDYFQQQVGDRLQRLGMTMLPAAGDTKRQGFVKDYAFAGSSDAILDVYVPAYGFFALSDRDQSPYRPGIAVDMRLVSTADHSILMQDRVGNVSVGASDDKATDPHAPSFATFDMVTANPARAVAALQFALAYAADAVGNRLA